MMDTMVLTTDIMSEGMQLAAVAKTEGGELTMEVKLNNLMGKQPLLM